MKKAERITCDCERCKYSKRGAGTIYCSYYDEFSPNRKSCARYWCVKPVPKNRKTKTANKPQGKKKHSNKFQLCAQLRVCSQAGGNPVYPRFSQPDNSESWDGVGNGI